MSDRVLLLTHCFPPTALPESLLSAKRMGSLPELEVDVVCSAWNPGFGTDHSLDDYVASRFGQVTRVDRSRAWRLVRLGRFEPLHRRPDPYRLLNGPVRRAARREISATAYVAVVTWSQMHSIHLVGRTLKRRLGLPWLAHFSDPWVDNPFLEASPRERLHHERLELSVIAEADRVLFTSAETADLVMAKYPESWRRKTHVLPHAFDERLYPATAGGTPNDPLVFRYLGAFYGTRSPRPLVEALRELSRRDPQLLRRFRIEIVGRVESGMIAENGFSDTLTVRPHVDYLRSLELMATADALLVVDAPAALSPFLPSKLVDYVGARRPIAALTPAGAAARLVRRLGGPVADPSDPRACAAALSSLVELAEQRRPFGDEAVRGEYRATVVGSEMEALIRAAARQ